MSASRLIVRLATCAVLLAAFAPVPASAHEPAGQNQEPVPTFEADGSSVARSAVDPSDLPDDPAQMTYLVLKQESGANLLGKSAQVKLAPPSARVQIDRYMAKEWLTVTFTVRNERYSVSFSAPQKKPIAVGAYADAQPLTQKSPVRPGFGMSLPGCFCSIDSASTVSTWRTAQTAVTATSYRRRFGRAAMPVIWSQSSSIWRADSSSSGCAIR